MTDIVECQGVKVPLNPNFISGKIERSLRKQKYELDEVSGIPKFVEPDDRIIELGAGIGFISTFVQTTIGVKGFMCIEASPKLCEFIQEVHALNRVKGVEVKNLIALGDAEEEGTTSFYEREQFWSSSMDDDEPYANEIQVPTKRLSTLIKDFKANTLIVDIEGGEKYLFQTMDLRGIDKIYLEIHTRKIKRIGIKMCFDALSAAGFAYDQQVSCGGSVLFRRIPKWQF